MSSIYRRSLASFVPAALAVTAIIAIAAFLSMDAFYGDVMRESLGSTARALASSFPAGDEVWLGEVPGRPEPSAIAWVKSLDSASGLRVTLMRPDGVVVADSRADPATMENHGERPEMRAALAGGTGTARRTSVTIGRELFYAAHALRDSGGRIVGVLRVAIDLPTIRARLAPARDALLAAVLCVGAAAALAAAFFARGVSMPLRRLSVAARALSAGGAGLDEIRLAALASGPDEVRILAGALDSMLREIAGRDRSELLAGRERRAILDGMSEAVVGLDSALAVRTANRAAQELFGFAGEAEARGRSLVDATRSVEIAAFAAECMECGERLEREMSLFGKGGERWFRVLAAPYGDTARAAGRSPEARSSGGLVLVLEDITRLRRLERVRRDFVANVSHELRTPVQVIKGFAETLREEGLADPDRASRFIGIIERNAARMESLIGDLLTLARLEQEGDMALELREENVAALVEEAVAAVAPRAEAKRMPLSIDADRSLRARVHGGLLVQALVNLVDNAVKYAPAGTPVAVSCRVEDEGRRLLFEVRDRGPGIPARDIPRLFERFYTVDKARSRELGGTGLGLAIVRHVALAHGGEAGAESWEDEGSRFWIAIPLAGDLPASAIAP